GTPGPSALDELLRRARNAGGGGGGGGRPGIPGVPGPRSLWGIGIAILVAVWLLWSCFHPIGPQQRGVVTMFGSYAGTLDPGVRLTLPSPIASVTKVDVQQIRIEKFPDSGDQENLMLTSDQNIVNLSFSVRWTISNPEDYVFQIKDPVSTVRATAESVMREVVANMSLDDAIGSGRSLIESQVQDRMQRILDEYKSGVHVQGVTLNGAVPPQSVKESFNAVIAAQQNAIATKNKARGYAQQLMASAQGEAARFDKVYEQYKLAPEVTRKRMYYETMEAVLSKTDKVVLEAPGVMPYLPIGARKLPEAAPQPEAGK
ncbi:MAG: protease modulator HflK, partial [Pseudomonadota bacterium]|nr:protease modulator HflK [Pseudomonadota bacterium]